MILTRCVLSDAYVAKEIVKDRKKISKGICSPFLLDITELLFIDTPSREYLVSSDAHEFLNAGAIYTKDKLLSFLGGAWILLDKPSIPIRVFNDESAAIRWLTPFTNLN